jgi:chemotaxis protein MotA
VGLLAHIGGQPPVMAIEFARKALMSEVRPTFAEVEASTAALPSTT